MPDHDAPRAHGGPEHPFEPGQSQNIPPERSRYLIQKPESSSRHFELRLEINGLLVSWAIPTHPSLDLGDKRLAIRTPDHSLDAADIGFEILGDPVSSTGPTWDQGVFDNLADRPVEAGLAEGRLRIWLDGVKLHGAFALDRTKLSKNQEQWLLIKKDDGAELARHPVPTRLEPVLTSRTGQNPT